MKRYYIILFLFVGLTACLKFDSSEYREVKMESGLKALKTLFLKDRKIESGAKILFLKDESLPFIQFSLWFPKAGSDYDWENKSGLAQLTAYMLDQGAGGLSSEKLQEKLNQLGTELSIDIGRQTVRFSIDGLSWHQEKLFDLFKKIITEPHFESVELETLRKQFIDRRVQNLDRTDFIADTLLRSKLFQGSISKSKGGDLVSLSQINLKDIKTFYKQHYLNGNPIFMIVGNFDDSLENTAKAFINDNFSYQATDFKPITTPDLKTQLLLVTNENLSQAEARLAYSLFPFPTQNPRQFIAFQLANSVLGGGSMTSRLFNELREKRGLTYGVYSFLNLGKLYGFFDISGATKTSSVKEFLEQSLLVLNNFKEKGISLEELNTAKQTVKMRYLRRTETPEDKLYQVAYYKYYLGLSSNFLDHYIQTIDDISLEEVNLSIKDFVLSKPLQIIIYGHPSIQSQLEEMTDFPLSVISFKDYFKEELALIK